MTAQSIPESNRWDQEVVDGFSAFIDAREQAVGLCSTYRTPTQTDRIMSGSFLAMRAAAKRILAVANMASTDMAPVARFAEAILDAIPPRADRQAFHEFTHGSLNGPIREADAACAGWRNRKRSSDKPAPEQAAVPQTPAISLPSIVPTSTTPSRPSPWTADGKRFVPTVRKLIAAMPAKSWDEIAARVRVNADTARSYSKPMQDAHLIKAGMNGGWEATETGLAMLANQAESVDQDD